MAQFQEDHREGIGCAGMTPRWRRGIVSSRVCGTEIRGEVWDGRTEWAPLWANGERGSQGRKAGKV